MKALKNRTPEQEAIAFMRSMVKLVEARGWRVVHFEFANYMLGMADKILTHDPDGKDEHAPLDRGGHVFELFENFERVPIPLFKGIIDALIEQMSHAKEASNAQRAA